MQDIDGFWIYVCVCEYMCLNIYMIFLFQHYNFSIDNEIIFKLHNEIIFKHIITLYNQECLDTSLFSTEMKLCNYLRKVLTTIT